MDKRRPETIRSLTNRIKQIIEGTFPNILVEGELSNVKIMSSGHAYFVLKDEKAQISCAFFSITRRMPAFEVKDGVKVRVYGDVSVYPPRGAYQIIIQSMEPAGVGDLMQQFEALKKKLEAEGLFDKARKRPLPMLPRKIGIVTSPTGAAIRDMLNVIKRRFDNVHIVIAPARVQGKEGTPEIVDGIETLNRMPDPPDVIIVGRGGGSIEDLWCFNEEAVARAIYHSAIPILSAVGHEIDFTIADFVADLRAPTPSAAAELVVGRKAAFDTTIETNNIRLRNAMRTTIERARTRIDLAAGSHVFRQPETLLRQHTQHIDILAQQLNQQLKTALANSRERLNASTPRITRATENALHSTRLQLHLIAPAIAGAAKSTLATSRHRLDALSTRLESVNPTAVLARGYAIVKTEDGTIAKCVSDVQTGEILTTQLSDGEIQSVAIDGNTQTRRPARRKRSPDPDQLTLL